MKQLIKYEFLKIFRRKSTLVVMAASLLVTAFLFSLPVLQFQTYSQDGVIKGFEGIAYEKAQYGPLSVPLTDEYVAEQIQAVSTLFDDPENVGYDGNEQFLIGDAYWNEIAPKESLLSVIATTYIEPGLYAGYNALPDLDIENGANFYGARAAKIEALLNTPSATSPTSKRTTGGA